MQAQLIAPARSVPDIKSRNNNKEKHFIDGLVDTINSQNQIQQRGAQHLAFVPSPQDITKVNESMKTLKDCLFNISKTENSDKISNNYNDFVFSHLANMNDVRLN